MGVRLIKSERHSRKMRVGAYVRVSTYRNEQEESYEAQAKYYENFIRGNPDWDFAGVYGEKESGTHLEKRDAFNQMVQDAVDHKIDLIYCKSVSRWARNAVDALDMVKRLTGHHAHVIFEQEGIDTREPGMLLQLSLAASIAQSESESISENIKWVYRHRAAHGIFKPHKGMYFGFNTDKGTFEPDKNAGFVKLVFDRFVEGESFKAFADELNRLGVRTNRGSEFQASTIRSLLTHEVYVGDVQFGKTPSRNIITGELDEVQIDRYMKNHHEGIIDRATWDAAQKRLKEMKEARENEEHRKMRVLHVIMADPKVTVDRITKVTGIEPKQVGKYISALKRIGRIEKEDGRWVICSTAKQTQSS